MPTVEIKITVPEGTDVTIISAEGAVVQSSGSVDDGAVERYWRDYLSNNARKVFGAAARIERRYGQGYTLDDIARTLSLTVESVRSLHRTSGRTAKKWREDTGTPEPIQLVEGPYEWNEQFHGMRTTYRLPDGVAETIEFAPLVIA